MTNETAYIKSPPHQSPWRQVAGSLRRRGLARTLSLTGGKAVSRVGGQRVSAWKETVWQRESLRYDQRHNLQTAGWVALRDLSVTPGSGCDYIVMRPLWSARELLGRVQIPYEEFTFIDYGSGMGRVLFLAAEFPYHKIVGVEFARELHDIAVKNIASFRNPKQRCHEIEAVCASAEQFSVPDGNLVVCFFNPFGPEIMGPVLSELQRAHRLGRKVYILYGKPRCGFMMDAAPWLRKTDESLFTDCWYSAYESVAPESHV